MARGQKPGISIIKKIKTVDLLPYQFSEPVNIQTIILNRIIPFKDFILVIIKPQEKPIIFCVVRKKGCVIQLVKFIYLVFS